MGTEIWIISLPLSDSILCLKIIHPPKFREEPLFCWPSLEVSILSLHFFSWSLFFRKNDIPGRWYSLWDCLSNSPDMSISGWYLLCFPSWRLHISIYGLCQCIILRIHEYISPVTAVVWTLFLFQFRVCCSRPVPLSAYCRQGFQSPYHQCLFPCYCNQWCSTSYYWPIQCSVFHAELSAVHDYRIHSESLYHGCAS